nr:unnamed protein product [Callosobruchus chinensis]
MKEQKERARANWTGSGEKSVENKYVLAKRNFVGYERDEVKDATWGLVQFVKVIQLQLVLTKKETRLKQKSFSYTSSTLCTQKILGDHVTQKGSLVAPNRLRFDFSHNKPVTSGSAVFSRRYSLQKFKVWIQAIDEGAMALFGEKYGDKVRVIKIGDSKELLWRYTHVERTGEIGLFKIAAECSVASGVRRIEALNRSRAINYVRNNEISLKKVAEFVKHQKYNKGICSTATKTENCNSLHGNEKDKTVLIVKINAKELVSTVTRRDCGGNAELAQTGCDNNKIDDAITAIHSKITACKN